MAKVKTNLAIAMHRSGITGAEISRALGVGEAVISHWKHGRFYVPEKYRARVAELLGVPVNELFDEHGLPKFAE